MCACCASPAQESGVAASSLLGLHAYSSTASTSDADLHKASPAKQQHRDAGVMYQSEASTSNLSSSTSVGWMAGPQASRQAKRVDEEWHAVTDQATGAVHYRSVLTGMGSGLAKTYALCMDYLAGCGRGPPAGYVAQGALVAFTQLEILREAHPVCPVA